MNYAVINEAGEIVNVVSWDGVSEWHPGPSLQAVPIPPGAGVGTKHRYINNEFVRPEPPADPTA